jgi:hypothetical protein
MLNYYTAEIVMITNFVYNILLYIKQISAGLIYQLPVKISLPDF